MCVLLHRSLTVWTTQREKNSHKMQSQFAGSDVGMTMPLSLVFRRYPRRFLGHVTTLALGGTKKKAAASGRVDPFKSYIAEGTLLGLHSLNCNFFSLQIYQIFLSVTASSYW